MKLILNGASLERRTTADVVEVAVRLKLPGVLLPSRALGADAAALSEADKSAWCRAQGIYPAELDQWCASATTALAEPQDARASPQATRHDRKRIKELERELLRKDRALAETAALLVLSKKVAAIYNKGEDA